jgi:hypothetical protein
LLVDKIAKKKKSMLSDSVHSSIGAAHIQINLEGSTIKTGKKKPKMHNGEGGHKRSISDGNQTFFMGEN